MVELIPASDEPRGTGQQQRLAGESDLQGRAEYRFLGQTGTVPSPSARVSRTGMEFFATHHDFVVIWRREAIEGGSRLEVAMGEHIRPFLERAVAAGRLPPARASATLTAMLRDAPAPR